MSEYEDLGEHLRTYEQLLDEYAKERGPGGPPTVRLGFGTLDADLRGISPGQVCGFAARTSVGKTFALASVERNCAAIGVVSLSLEMPGLEWAERAFAIYEDVAPESVEGWAKQGQIKEEWHDFLEATKNVLICERGVHLEHLDGIVAAARQRIPVRVVLIDYLGILGARGRDSYERASLIGKGLKEFSKRSKVAVVVAMQLSRAAGDGSTPVTLDMLRDSGVIEEAMDFVIGCWRPGRNVDATVAEQMALEDVMRCRILKNRKGTEGREVDLTFRPQSRRLVETTDPFRAAL